MRIIQTINILKLGVILSFSLCIGSKTGAQPKLLEQNSAHVAEVESVGITVSDMDEALAFYTNVLPFTKISDVEVHGSSYEAFKGIFGLRMRVAQLKLGNETIELTDYLTPEGRDIPLDSRSYDHWFQHIAIVVSDMDKAYQHLRNHNVQHVSTGPQTLPESIKAAAGIQAFYFQDPDRHNLEIIHFPPDKGDPRWQKTDQDKSNTLFLGIDHTAIVVSNTENSLKFYRDLLGLTFGGESENFGTEQEHLNNVFGARLQITGLKPPMGPAVEFLQYLAPPGGKPYPSDARANDLIHWETTLRVKDIDAAAQRLQAENHIPISVNPVTLPDTTLGFKEGFIVRDPDGHALRIIE